MITLADAEYPVPMSEIQLKKKSQVSFTRRPHRTLWMLIYYCGLRIGETLSLPPADIKVDEGLIYIRGGKGSKDRRVPLASRVLTEICKYYKAYPPKQFLNEGQHGSQYRYGNINIEGKAMVHYLPNGNDIGVKYAYIKTS